MDGKHRGGAFADGRGYPSIGAGTHVAHGEHTGDAGFEHQRIAVERPRAVDAAQLRAGHDESLFVDLNETGEGFCAQARKGGVDLQALGARMSARKKMLLAQIEQAGLPAPTTRTFVGHKLGRAKPLAA